MKNYISAVRFNSHRSQISHLKVHYNCVDYLTDPVIKSKTDVIGQIEGGYIFYTIYQSSDTGKLVIGSEVHVVYTNYGNYLRTDKNNTPKDNLENLPEF